MPHQIIENIGQDRTFRNIVSFSTGLALACMFGSLASLRINRETGLSFQWHWSIVPWMVAGASAAWYFWRLVWAAQTTPTPENKRRLTRFSIALLAMGAGAFLYPIRYVFAGYRNEISLGLLKAVGTISLRYVLDDDELVVEGTGRFSDGLGNEPAVSALSKQILAAVVDECELSAGAEGPRFRLVKRHRSS